MRDLLRNNYRKLLNIVKINIGAEELIDLKNRKIEEFTKNMIILDGDQPENSSKNILTLPGGSGPDKMLYEFLHNLPPDDPFGQIIHAQEVIAGRYASKIITRCLILIMGH